MKEFTTNQSVDINQSIANQVRRLRTQRNLTLDALAAKSGVSRSMLSVVERGESSPTAVLLEKIACGLEVSLASLFNDANAAASPLSTPKDRRHWKDPQSGYVRCNISPENFPSPIQIVEVTLPAGARVAYDSSTHRTATHQQILVQVGRIEVSHGGNTQLLSAGDCYAMRLDGPTAFRNRTRTAARYYVVIATTNGSH